MVGPGLPGMPRDDAPSRRAESPQLQRRIDESIGRLKPTYTVPLADIRSSTSGVRRASTRTGSIENAEMTLALVGTAIAQMFVPFIALVFLKTNVAPGAAVSVIGLNGVFIVLFAMSALLFRRRGGFMKCRRRDWNESADVHRHSGRSRLEGIIAR